LAAQAAALLKPMTLELGGKAPAIVLEQADLDEVLPVLAMGLFANQGHICAANTRILVHRSKQSEVVEGLSEIAKQHKRGDALDPESTMGPLTTRRAVDRVLGYIGKGQAQGAVLAAGGRQGELGGYYVQPTVSSGTNEMTIAREEIFGPVGIVIPFDTNDEAIAIANDTEYGHPRWYRLDQWLWTDRPSCAMGRSKS
jgi:acyl-CoA reductase-like NAD-dependent aldehyde dehydrogenase